MTVAHKCKYPAPSRVWEQTENGWTSREWKPAAKQGQLDEKTQYERDVLGR